MPTLPENYQYYPALSDLIDIGDMPEFLSFIKDGLQQALSKTYFKDYQSSLNIDGSSGFYSLAIVSKQKFALEIPGTGIFFVLNPDYSDSTISSFPVSLFWQWEILTYIKYFKVNGFSFAPEDFYKLALKIFKITEQQVLQLAIDTFVYPSNDTITAFQQLIADINLLYSSTIAVNENDDDKFEQLNAQIQLLNKEVIPTIFTIYLIATNPAQTFEKINYFLATFLPTNVEEYIKNIIKPKIRANVKLTAAIEFPRSVLTPMKLVDTRLEVDNTLDTQGNLIKSYFQFVEGDFYVDTERGGFGSDVALGGSLSQPSQIGKTGLIISLTGAKLDTSTTTNILEADAAGYPIDFVGLYIQEASITLGRFGAEVPGHPTIGIFAENLLLGTGGVTGTIGLRATDKLYRDFGKFKAELNLFSLTFRQGTITQCNIEGLLTIPGFKTKTESGAVIPATLKIQANIFDNGDFSITAKPLAELAPISLLGVFDLTVRTLEVGRLNNSYYVEVSGVLDFTANVPLLGEVLPKKIEIHRLRIWDDGHLEFAAGRIKLQKAFKLEVGPVKLEVVELSLAPYKKGDRTYSSITFDGMINTGRAGVNVGGNGIKYYFSTDTQLFDHFLRIEGIDIDIRVPGDKTKDANFLLKGHLSMKSPEISGTKASTEYAGSVTFDIPKLDFGGSAGMRLNPSIPAFLVDMNIELATPTPIGATGLGIYGFRGLFGQHYVPNKAFDAIDPVEAQKAEERSWLEYYRAPTKGVNIDKFASKPGLSLGAGASIATSFDSGKTFSSKLFLLLGLPDVFLLEGQAAILRKRLGIDDDVEPPFTALIIIGDQAFLKRKLRVSGNQPRPSLKQQTTHNTAPILSYKQLTLACRSQLSLRGLGGL